MADQGYFLNVAVHGQHYCNVRIADVYDDVKYVRDKAEFIAAGFVKMFPNDPISITVTKWRGVGEMFPISITGN